MTTTPMIKVLLLDDDEQDFVVVQKMLDRVPERRFRVDWLPSFAEAVEAIERNEHDVYLIDYLIGSDNGLELLSNRIYNGHKPPMILMTAHDSSQLDQQAIQMGAADYIPKRELSPTLLGRTILHAIERNQLLQKLYYQATHDGLTGLYNRKLIVEQLESLVSSALRHRFPLSFCLCDLDSFKQINDRYGHQMGDRVLATFGATLKRELRAEDLPGRYGGDELCIIFPHVDAVGAMVCLERVRHNLRQMRFTTEGGVSFRATASFGVAELSERVNSADAMISNADEALYRAKERGRDCCTIAGV